MHLMNQSNKFSGNNQQRQNQPLELQMNQNQKYIGMPMQSMPMQQFNYPFKLPQQCYSQQQQFMIPQFMMPNFVPQQTKMMNPAMIPMHHKPNNQDVVIIIDSDNSDVQVQENEPHQQPISIAPHMQPPFFYPYIQLPQQYFPQLPAPSQEQIQEKIQNRVIQNSSQEKRVPKIKKKETQKQLLKKEKKILKKEKLKAKEMSNVKEKKKLIEQKVIAQKIQNQLDLDYLLSNDQIYDLNTKNKKRINEQMEINQKLKPIRLKKQNNEYIRTEEIIIQQGEQSIPKIKCTQMGIDNQVIIKPDEKTLQLELFKQYSAKKVTEDQCSLFQLYQQLVKFLLSEAQKIFPLCNDEDVASILSIQHYNFYQTLKFMREQDSELKNYLETLHQTRKNEIKEEDSEAVRSSSVQKKRKST